MIQPRIVVAAQVSALNGNLSVRSEWYVGSSGNVPARGVKPLASDAGDGDRLPDWMAGACSGEELRARGALKMY